MLSINERFLLDAWNFVLKCTINSFIYFIATIYHVLNAPMSTVWNYEIQFYVYNAVVQLT